MRRIIILCLIFSVVISVFSVPAHRGKRIGKTIDGETVEYYKIGDETYHYLTDMQGRMFSRTTDGYLEEVNVADIALTSIVGKRQVANNVRRVAAQRRISNGQFPSRGLVILVAYSDLKFDNANDSAAFDDMLNGDNYTFNGATGSVKQYFSDQSSGVFVPQFDVYGPVTLSNNKAYYGSNDRYGNDKYLGKMVQEACELAYEKYNIDFSLYDADNDGYVDFVDILYAGYGEADSDDEDSVWPCEWSLSASDVRKALSLGGKKIDTFSCHQEKDGYGIMKGKRAGIGTPCHEFSHVFGLPDLYDTDYKYVTLGDWDIMDGGAYNNYSRTPPGFSGYERMFAGWAKPRLINEAENITLSELQQSQEVLVMTSTGQHNLDATAPSPSTFYLLENRQQIGWDKYLPGHGMLIWKIIYNYNNWIYNAVNNAARSKQGVAIIPADGTVDNETYKGTVYTYGDAGDTYPGTSKITSYTGLNNYPITDIAENNGIITFKFMGGKEEATDIQTIDDYTGISIIGNTIIANQSAIVFTIDGREVTNVKSGHAYSLPQGLYLIKTEKDITTKISIQ